MDYRILKGNRAVLTALCEICEKSLSKNWVIRPMSRFVLGYHGRWFVNSWFHFQKVMGFVLATMLVGPLTLLAG